MKVSAFVISPYMSNCYVLTESEEPGAKCVIIDPGDTALEPVFSYIIKHGLHVEAIWNTHAHIDHVLGVDRTRDVFGVTAVVHMADLPIWNRVHETALAALHREISPLRAPDGYLEDGDKLCLGDLSFEVWHTPGHSPGGVCFIGDTFSFTGDTLFAGTIGRTDFPESNPADMQVSLRRLSQLPDEMILYPGHMGKTTMGEEHQSNPFLRGLSR